MQGGFLIETMRLGRECFAGRVSDANERERLHAFLESPFGVAAARRANDLFWLTLELAYAAEDALLEGAPELPPAELAELRLELCVTLGRLLPDAAAAEIGAARARGLLVYESAAPPSPIESEAEPLAGLRAWLIEAPNSALFAELFAVVLHAECRAFIGVSGLAEPALVPARLERALLKLAALLARIDGLGELRCRAAVPDAPSTRAPRLDEDVQFTVFKPRSVAPLVWTKLLAFAHLGQNPPDAAPGSQEPRERVRAQAEALLGGELGSFEERAEDAGSPIPREGQLAFVPDFPGIDFEPPHATFVWLGEVQRVEFQLRAARELAGKLARGKLRVLYGGLILAELNLSIRVEASAKKARAAELERAASARAYRKIFASYAHADTAIVQHVSAYARAVGDQYLIDYVSLRSGEDWSEGLERLIREADVFQLFWSKRSMLSSFVRREWEYALSLGRPGFVRPTYWETPLPESPEQGLPPAALRALHFSCIALPRAPEVPPLPAADPRPGLNLLGGLATGSAAVLLTLRTGALDRATSAAERLSAAAARVLERKAGPSSVPSPSSSLADPTLHAVPELDAQGAMPVLLLVLGLIAVLRGKRPRRQSSTPATQATRLVASSPPNMARSAMRDRSARRSGASTE
jgi:hypothetical protein